MHHIRNKSIYVCHWCRFYVVQVTHLHVPQGGSNVLGYFCRLVPKYKTLYPLMLAMWCRVLKFVVPEPFFHVNVAKSRTCKMCFKPKLQKTVPANNCHLKAMQIVSPVLWLHLDHSQRFIQMMSWLRSSSNYWGLFCHWPTTPSMLLSKVPTYLICNYCNQWPLTWYWLIPLCLETQTVRVCTRMPQTT